MSQVNNRGDAAAKRVSTTDFLRSFFQDYRTVGAVRETSRGVAERIVELSGVKNAVRIAEFGCGTGPITKVILERMPESAKLWGYEIHEPFVKHLKQTIHDPRFTLFEESATAIAQHREERNEPPFDAIISTIPFSYLERSMTIEILRTVIDSMTDEGTFVALQYHPTYLPPMLRREFDSVKREIYPLNIPPTTLLTATKPRRF
jgi:phospholipid N-methyltransferase